MLTKTKNWTDADGPWKVQSTREAGVRILATDEDGSVWQCLEQNGEITRQSDHALAPSVLAAMATAQAAIVAAKAAAAAKEDAAAGPAVVAKLRDVAAGNGTLTQPQIAKALLWLLRRE